MTRFLPITLLSLLVALPLSADEPRPKLPSLKELDRFITQSKEILGSNNRKQPSDKAPLVVAPKKKTPPPKRETNTAKNRPQPTAEDRQAAYELAQKLLENPKIGHLEHDSYHKEFIEYGAPGVLAILYPLTTYPSEGEVRRLIFKLAQELLPKVFLKDKTPELERGPRGEPGKGRDRDRDGDRDRDRERHRLYGHDSQHLALRQWMTQKQVLKDPLLAQEIKKRIDKTLKLLRDLTKANDDGVADRIRRALIKSGEEWVVWPLAQTRLPHEPAREAANEVIEHFTGSDVTQQVERAHGKRKRGSWEKRWARKAQAIVTQFIFHKSCPYCQTIVNKHYIKSGD